MFVRVYASGTNVQRLAKCSKDIDGVIHTSYAELEQTEPDIVKRRFFRTHVDGLKREVEKLPVTVYPSWAKIWGWPLANQAFIEGLLQSLVGANSLCPELNLSVMAGKPISCFVIYVSANNKEMGQIAQISKRNSFNWEIVVLNGDYTTNRDAEDLAERKINEARLAEKHGVIFIANQMGSRSFSVPEIQATVLAYDRGSVDSTQQKTARCLTPTNKTRKLYDGKSDKKYGMIVDLSFDPNRAENIERILLEEAIMVQRSKVVEDFSAALKYVLTSVDLFKMNEYGHVVEVKEGDLFALYGDNEVLLKVADISIDVVEAMESGVFDILSSVNNDGKGNVRAKKPVVGENAVNFVGGKTRTRGKIGDKEKREAEKVINGAIKALNMSATSVYNLANLNGESYRECLGLISSDPVASDEFEDFFGIPAKSVSTLLDRNVLNEAILDVIVQNSKPQGFDNLFL